MGKVAWGLDLAGFSNNKQGLARSERNNNNIISTKVYNKHPFKHTIKSTQSPRAAEERISMLNKCNPIYIDSPIDTQSLPDSICVEYVWQITKRAIDKCFKALSPYGSNMGSYVSQVKCLLQKSDLQLNKNLYETYPRASLYLLNKLISYKNSRSVIKVKCDNNIWSPLTNNSTNKHLTKRYGLPCLCNELGLKARDDTVITDNEFDAIICSLCGVVDDRHLLKDFELTKYLTSHFSEYFCSPRGYRLLYLKDNAKWPYTIKIEKVDKTPFDDCKDT